MLAFAQTLALALAAPSAAGAAAKALPATDGEPIVIRADRAWEAAAEGAPGGAEGQVLHLQGNFEMRGADWRVTADSAQVRGPVEDPEQLTILGAPAEIAFTNEDGDVATGQGQRIVYWRRREVVELHGDARIQAKDFAIGSSKIVYDLRDERLLSSGGDGVEFVLSGEAAQGFE